MITNGKEAKEKLLAGINKTADIVKSTLGYRGRTVMIADQLRLGFHITKDGVTVAKSVNLEDEVESLGAEFIKQASNKTVLNVGDSTTSTAVLTQKMCNMVQDYLELGVNPHNLKNDLLEDLDTVIRYIQENSSEVKNSDDIYKLAMVSSNNDDEIAGAIKQVYDATSMSVEIDVAESDTDHTTFQVVKGYTIPETGYVAPIFINNREKGRVEYNNPKIYIMNGKIRQLNAHLGQLFQDNTDRNSENFRPMVLICEDIEEGPLREIYEAVKQQMLFDVCVVRTNLIYDDRKQVYVDASRVLNADYEEERVGNPGTCEKVIIEDSKITFINGAGDTTSYVEALKKQYQESGNAFLKKRIFALESNAAVIRIGGKLLSQIDEKKDRAEDAVFAVKSAIEEGYSAGGSSVLINAHKDLELKTQIMKESLLECYKQLMMNAGLEPMYYLREIHDKGKNHGFNLITQEVSDMVKDGIYDSTKGLRISMENAVHTAITFAFIENIIS